MDARTSAPLIPTALLALCLAVVAAGTSWTAWDMFGPNHRPLIQGADDSFYYFWLPSVVIDHDLDFTNQLAQSDTLDESAKTEALSLPRTPTGLVPNKYPPGWALGSLPFFLAAQVFAPAGATGFEPCYLVAVWLGQLVYAAAGLWCATRVLGRFFPERTAAIAVFAGWLASPLVYYQSARLAMTHSQVFALVAAVSWLAWRIHDGDDRRRTWAALGFCAALLVVTRNVTLIYLALPAWIVIQRLRSMRAAVWLVLGAAGPAAVQLAAWKILYGSWLVYSYGGERFDFTHWHTLAILFSPRHGWFYWHPAMLVAIAAFIAWAVRRPVARIWLLSLAAILVLNAAWPVWWLGSSFGNRGFEGATLFAMIGLAFLLEAASTRPRWRTALAAALGLAIAGNLVLLGLFVTHRISRDEPVTYGDMARALASGASRER